MKTPDQWFVECPSNFDGGFGDCEVEWIKRIQSDAYHEGQLAGLKMGKETAMKTINEVFSDECRKPAE